YWSLSMRNNVTRAFSGGTSLGFFAANTMSWQIRYESDTHGTANRTIVGYKENWKMDPDAASSSTLQYVTGAFRNWRYSYPPHREDALLGVMEAGYPVTGDMIVSNPTHWVWSNTGAVMGTHLIGLLGYEVDAEFGDQPSDTVVLANSPYATATKSGYSQMTIY